VSVEAAKWEGALSELGFDTFTVAGEGRADRLVRGLAAGAQGPPDEAELADALAPADLVVAENICSLPLNPAASEAVARALRGRRAILRHHDLPWQRDHLSHLGPPPTDTSWLHVTINEMSRRQLAERGIQAVTFYNLFDTSAPPGDRHSTRRAIGVAEGEVLLLQPTRAIPRKNVPEAVALADALSATYWLLGPTEDGYEAELGRVLSSARARVVLGQGPGGERGDARDAYAACDAVVLPSSWEGFGNPSIESAVHRKPLAIGSYPVASELEGLGFRWFPSSDPRPLARWLERPDDSLLVDNLEVARAHFDLAQLPARLERLMRSAGWSWRE
jgi:glycosyltransferase involved in cell wall biosynthesis